MTMLHASGLIPTSQSVCARSTSVCGNRLCISWSSPPLFRDPVSDLSRILTQAGVEFDAGTTSDGTGSLKISAADSTTVRL